MTKLPDKASELIRLALGDLRKVEADPKYTVSMGLWYMPEEENSDVCLVCLAGAVMAKSLNSPRGTFLLPSDFSERLNRQLNALNYFGEGCVERGLFISLQTEAMSSMQYPKDRKTADYHTDREGFYCDMEKLAKELEECGL